MAETDSKSLESEAQSRKKEAQTWKSHRLLDFKECYFFAAPDRSMNLTSQQRATKAQPAMGVAPELNTDVAFLLVDDFVTELVNTYLPEAQIWCERSAGMDVPEDAFAAVKDQVRADDKKIFAAIRASNLYSELPKAFNPDIAIACAGIYIHRRAPHLPIEVLAVPMREMEINLGPNGEIDDRFIVRFARNCHVRTQLTEEVYNKLDQKTRTEIEAKPEGTTELTWGWWRLWDRFNDEVWQHTVMVGKLMVHNLEIVGEGCCPFIPMRFGAVADWPWAIGPLIKGLPSLRQVDDLTRDRLEAGERVWNPAIHFPDDSFANIEQGLEPGMAYPIRPGTEGAVGPIYKQPPIDGEIYQIDSMEHRLRKLFYVDFPEQSGDTPPTLGQWLDEMARAQRRIGTPGQSFWREGPMRIFLRFKYLLTKAGTIKDLQDKSGRNISTQPYNPAQRAAEQQEIATAFQCAQALSQMFPEGWRINADDRKTMENVINKMRTGGLLALRSPDEIKAAVAQISQLVGQGGLRQHAGAPVPEGAGAPAAA